MKGSASLIEGANLAVRFGLELCAIAALGYWGFHAGHDVVVKLGLGLGAPIAMVVTWGAFVAPKSASRLDDPIRLLLEVVIFALATFALALAGQPEIALVLAGAAAVNIALMFALDQRGR